MGKMSFLKGMGAGLMVGACVGMMMAPRKKTGKKAVGRAVKAVGEVIDEISSVIGL